MVPVLAVLFLVVPIAELAVLIEVGGAIGVGPTLALVVVVSVVGAWLAKRQGLEVLRRVRAQLGAGNAPAAELVDGLLILVAGALLLTPGFLTDAVALLLLLPPVRALVRARLRRVFAGRVASGVVGMGRHVRRARVVRDDDRDVPPPPSIPPPPAPR